MEYGERREGRSGEGRKESRMNERKIKEDTVW